MPKRKEASESASRSAKKAAVGPVTGKNRDRREVEKEKASVAEGETDGAVNWTQKLAVEGSIGKSSEIEIIHLETDSIGDHVPHSLKEKIWGSEYINLALLLKGSADLTNFCSSAPMVIGQGGIIETKQPVCKDKIPSLEKWTDAFLIFMSIYLKRYPAKLQDLLQYMSTIRSAATQGTPFGWRVYDEQFRARLAQVPGTSWAEVNTNLWLKVMTPQLQAQQIGSHANTNSSFSYGGERGTSRQYADNSNNNIRCNAYNLKVCHFQNCKYIHKCLKCWGSHKISDCPSNRPFLASQKNAGQPEWNDPYKFKRENNTFRKHHS